MLRSAYRLSPLRVAKTSAIAQTSYINQRKDSTSPINTTIMTKTKKDNAHTLKANTAHTKRQDAEAVEATYSAATSSDANGSIGGDRSLSLVFPEPDLTGAMGVNVVDVPANPDWDLFPVRWKVPTPPLPPFKNLIGNIRCVSPFNTPSLHGILCLLSIFKAHEL